MRAANLIHRHHKIDRFYAGLVHEIAGPTGCGKSRLCLSEIISFLHLFPGQAIIIDTNGTFSPNVMAELIASRQGDAHMLDRIQITRCLNLYGVIEVIQEIASTLTTTTTGSADGIGMVVIDSISNPVALMMQRGQTPGHDLMVCMMRELTLLSRRGLCVLLVNATVRADAKRRDETPSGGGVAAVAGAGAGAIGSNRDAAFSGVQIKPALGNTWPHLVDYSMLIYPVPEGTVRVYGKRGFIQEVIRSRVGGTGEWEMV